LTDCSPHNSKRVKSYGIPSKGDPKGGTLTVQGTAFLQNAETVPYEFLIELYGIENGFYYGSYIPLVVNRMQPIEEPILPKTSSVKKSSRKNFEAPKRHSKCVFWL